MIGPFRIHISRPAPVEELYRLVNLKAGKSLRVLNYVLCLCRKNTSTSSLLEGENPLQCLCCLISVFGQECVGGLFVLKGFRCSLRDNF